MSSSASPAGAGSRLFYIDDSGASDTGYIVYSWIEVTTSCWSAGLDHWLDLRKGLWTDFGVPAKEELHATQLIGGRGTPSTWPTVNNSKAQRQAVTERALGAIGANTDIQLGTVFRKTGARGKNYSRERGQVYSALVNHLDERLRDDDEFGAIYMDGDGTDPAYLRTHRDLDITARRIIEDPHFHSSHRSQWVQMADLVAWTTYQSLLQHPRKRFAWHWYTTYLRTRDINTGPISV